MQVFTDLDQVPDGFGPSVVTIGNFDGVHRGHQAVLGRLVSLARADDRLAVALTFDPHPAQVHRPETAPELLTGLSDRLDLLARTGLDAVLVAPYTLDLAAQTPEEFVTRYLVDGLGARTVVVGHDVRFGKGNAGTLATMVELGGIHGFEVVAVDDVGECAPGSAGARERWSSSAARALLAEGDVALLAPGTPVAHLAIPAIGLETVVVEGTASGVTASGPGHRRDTVLPGQPGTSVIMGRKDTYGGPFSRLHELSTGDVITVVTGQGEHTYEVISRRLTGDPMPPVPDDPETGRLTLTTAAGRPFLPDDVLRVDAELVSDPVPAAPRLIAAGSLPASEEAMSGDPDAWTPVLLYAQGMALVSLAVAWARRSWGGVQAWTAGVPVLGFFGLSLADQVSRLLPNLL